MTNSFTPVSLRGDGGKKIVRGQAAGHADAHRLDHLEANAFAPLRYGNTVECFTTGKEYFEALAKVMRKATQSILIAGWQVNWDVELTPGERLIDILHNRIQSSEHFRVLVMPWMSPKVGVDTGDLGTMLAVFQLNAGRKTMQAMCCPAGAQSDYTGSEGAAFSHHQKMIVVDNQYAYVGGMDVAYGRCDDASFSLDPGARRFRERYNPGVPATGKITAADGPCLSDMDLLATTFTYGLWDKGGNTEPGAMSKFLSEAQVKANKFAVEAVALVNKAARLRMDIEVAQLKAQVAGVKTMAKVSADVAMAAANAVSRQCAAMTVPDMYNNVQSLKVGEAPSLPVAGILRDKEANARRNVNRVIDRTAELTHFFAPLKALKVDPAPQSSLPGALERAERDARSNANAMIDEAAALAGNVQHGAESARMVCVSIGPGLERTVDEAKSLLREAERDLKAGAQAAIGQVNQFQRAVIEQINAVRSAINTRLLAMIEVMKRGAGESISKVSQENIEAVVGQLKHLLKLVYAQQLAVTWLHASAHPLLFDTRTKSAAAAVLGATQPRQPWQDVHCQIEGPSVDDLVRNFARRWDASNTSYLTDPVVVQLLTPPSSSDGFPMTVTTVPSLAKSMLDAVLFPAALLPPERPPEKAGTAPSGVAVRVLRSAPMKMCNDEVKAQKLKGKADAKSAQLNGKEQCEIQSAMIDLIKNATNFIYIENQFFQTAFGKPSIDVFSPEGRKLASGPVQFLMGHAGNNITARLSSAGNAQGKALYPANTIGEELGKRITAAIRYDQPFHVYLVLPEHPEGLLSDITIVGQVHWTMQSLVFAENSLVNRVRRAITARKLCQQPLNKAQWETAMEAAGQKVNGLPAYESVVEDQWAKYLTLLNLRNCQDVRGKIRTEQIYVHSKLLIVDDRHIIMGSANINDRSLSGHRDSEIAVMLLDCEKQMKPLDDRVTWVNHLARKLRVDLWNKHFALTSGGNGTIKAASEMSSLIERPASAKTVKAIQQICRTNAAMYHAVFPFIPWSTPQEEAGTGNGSSLWPTSPKGATAEVAGKAAEKMPFDIAFWSTAETNFAAPKELKGYFTALPVNWTINENNHPGEMSVMLLTQVMPESEERSYG